MTVPARDRQGVEEMLDAVVNDPDSVGGVGGTASVVLQVKAAHPIAFDCRDLPYSCPGERDREQADACVQVKDRTSGHRVQNRRHQIRHEKPVGLKERLRVPPKLTVCDTPARQDVERIDDVWIA